MALAASLAFALLREATALSTIAYVLALFSIADFWLGSIYFMDNIEYYPWAAVFPKTILQYLITQTSFSAIFVALEQMSLYQLPVAWFIAVHVAIMVFFTTQILAHKK